MGTTMATLSALFTNISHSLEAAVSSLPDPSTITPPTDGISLLDTKNELLLAYLQNLVFLIIIKLKNANFTDEVSSQGDVTNQVTRKLVELRLYLEKGVRPLEAKLKYQLDKLLAAASEADAASNSNLTTQSTLKPNGHLSHPDNPEEDSDVGQNPTPAENFDLLYRPNPAAFVRRPESARAAQGARDGVYKPPRIAPAALSMTDSNTLRSKRSRKSRTVDDFIREEVTDGPIAEPSIGAGSGLRGRAKEEDEERRAFEEQRLVRLPSQKKRKRVIGGGGDDLDVGFGRLEDVDFGDIKGRGKKRKQESGLGERIGERWEKRVKKGVGRRRR